MGLMVYAPHGRSGVYPLQSAFGRITEGLVPEEKLRVAKQVFAGLPGGHPFKCNPHLVDHKQSDAGFYDLLLHSSDRPYTISQLSEALGGAGLEIAGFPEPALYDPGDLIPDGSVPAGLDVVERAQLAENLRGMFKTHTIYVVRAGESVEPPFGKSDAVPVLRGVGGRQAGASYSGEGRGESDLRWAEAQVCCSESCIRSDCAD